MKIFNAMLFLLIVENFIFTAPGKKDSSSRVYSLPSRHVAVRDTRNNGNLSGAFAQVRANGQDYTLVPTHLIGSKLQRFFARTSAAVVAMSCCPRTMQTHVHRRCLQKIFHADQNTCSDRCPGCTTAVDRLIFAQSNACYVRPDFRKKNCDSCHQALGWRPVLKK